MHQVKILLKKTGTALVLLLSSIALTACSQSEKSNSFIIWAPLLCIFGPSVVGAVIVGIVAAIDDKINPGQYAESEPYDWSKGGDH